MLTKIQEKRLGYLLIKEKDATIRGLARAIKAPYALTYNNTQKLLQKENKNV